MSMQGDELPSRRIARYLREAIDAGEFAPGEKLPSERRLAEEFGAARNTAREAFDLLAMEGRIDVFHGRGAFVRASVQLLHHRGDRYAAGPMEASPFHAEAADHGRTATIICVAAERVRPPADVADHLGVDLGKASVLRRTDVFYADDAPVQRVTMFIPWKIADGTPIAAAEPVDHPAGIHGVLAGRGHRLARFVEEVSARMPRPAEAKDLRIPPGVPVIEAEHVGLDDDDRPFEVSRFVIRADQMALTYEVRVPTPTSRHS
ncbi:MAG: UTRA domain-containing protein [Streptosporangiales bacterium]|nr:UTRA domain-containing protein [Streptosporangiales bacterium]